MTTSSATATASATAEVLDRIVAVVNEDIILLSELNDRMTPYAQRIRQQGFALEQERQMLFKMREEVLNRMVDEKLTDQEIKRNGIQVDESEVDNAIESIKKNNYFTDEDLRQYLESEQLTMQEREKLLAAYLDNLREQADITYPKGAPEGKL